MSRDTVVFGHMHEDHSAELALVTRAPIGKCLVIASGGDLALSLAAVGRNVVAVDSNPAQVALVRFKIELAREVGPAIAAKWMVEASPALSARAGDAGMDSRRFAHGLCFCGRVDRALRYAGPIVAWLLRWPSLRPGYFRRILTLFLLRLLPIGIRLVHGRHSTRAVNALAIEMMKRRLLAAMSQATDACNPLLASTLGRGFGLEPPAVWREAGIRAWSARAASIELRNSSIQTVLEGASPGDLAMISLSNLADLLEPPEWRELLASAATALAPGGFIVARSMLHETLPPGIGDEIADITKATLAECGDRSPLCPVIWIGHRAQRDTNSAYVLR